MIVLQIHYIHRPEPRCRPRGGRRSFLIFAPPVAAKRKCSAPLGGGGALRALHSQSPLPVARVRPRFALGRPSRRARACVLAGLPQANQAACRRPNAAGCVWRLALRRRQSEKTLIRALTKSNPGGRLRQAHSALGRHSLQQTLIKTLTQIKNGLRPRTPARHLGVAAQAASALGLASVFESPSCFGKYFCSKKFASWRKNAYLCRISRGGAVGSSLGS